MPPTRCVSLRRWLLQVVQATPSACSVRGSQARLAAAEPLFLIAAERHGEARPVVLPTSLSRVVQRSCTPGAFGLVVWPGRLVVCPARGRDRAPGLLEFFRLAQFKASALRPKPPLVVCQLLLHRHPVGQRWWHGARTCAAASCRCQAAAICAWLLLQARHRHIRRYAALNLPGCSIWRFLPQHGCARDLSDGLLAPRLPELGGAGQAQAWHSPCWPAAWCVATDIGSYVIGRRLGRHPLSPISPGKTIEGAIGWVPECAGPVGVACVLLGCPWGCGDRRPARRSGLGVRLVGESDRIDDESGMPEVVRDSEGRHSWPIGGSLIASTAICSPGRWWVYS